MTILNISLLGDRVLLGVDTEVTTPGGAKHHYSKLLVLPHINAVVACRGELPFPQKIFGLLQFTDGDFDSICDQTPNLLKIAFRESKILAWAHGIWNTKFLDGQTIVLVGYSSKCDRFVAIEYTQEDRKRGFTVEHLKTDHLAPWHPSMGNVSPPRNAIEMEILARRQVEIMRKHAPQASAGGQLICVEIDKEGMRLWQACKLD